MTWPGYCTAACDLGSLLASSPCIARRDTRASPFACFSCVTSRDSHKWRACPRKILEILVGTSNGTDHFGLVLPEYSGPDLKVVHFDRSGHFGRSDRNVPFHLTKLLFPVPLFCILLTRTITSSRNNQKREVQRPGSKEYWKADQNNVYCFLITIFQLAIPAFFTFTDISIGNSMISSDIWHKYHEWYFKIVIRNFTSR